MRLRKGLNIPIKGAASARITKTVEPDILAVQPTDYRLLTPKLLVQEGDTVKAGSPLFADKKNPSVLFVSPVSGTVSNIVRGEKRKILAVLIKADNQNEYLHFDVPNPKSAEKEEIIKALLESGLWCSLKQRPYGIIPDPEKEPKSIFISSFDSAPLAPDPDFALKGEIDFIQTGIDMLKKLTKGAVHLSMHIDNYAGTPFHRLERVIHHTFEGKHPAGNPGVQIHHIDPVNKGDIVWTIDPYSLAAIGKLFTKGIYDVKRVISVTGPMAVNPSYIETLPGISMQQIKEYIAQPVKRYSEMLSPRIISGNVLTGTDVGENGYLGFFSHQITILPEGNYREMFGWAKPLRYKKFSISRSYFSWLTPKKEYSLDTNLNGGERAFVITGLYEKVLPMDIYPMYLLKAILAKDIDRMEALGIYEVIEEDFALCEFVCPSKVQIQEIIREGIELMIKEMS
ncbi:MAG: Na(+)-translocating NADH-quinone reductase subunit A [Bacteroidales bacterium]|nr:Na(+)-translocating NADH-quinone reductase subunit A [Bacteroidales bacterium]